ncbi:MAG: response regulator transcription factor [Chloroflexi bacterium]|nr:response regulator transcription factor [Chloroflexota bacterium]
MRTVRVLLAEDHAVVREGTRQILEADAAIEVVGEAADGAAAIALAARLRPDVVLLDLHMPGINGIEATRRLVADSPDARVLILSAYDEEDYVAAALEAGARGYLLKSSHGREVVAAIHAVAQGQVVMDARVARRALRHRDAPAADEPTPREVDVLRLAARGLRTKEIAAELGTSTRTIEAHFTSIFNRFGVTTRTEAVMYAASRRWIRPQEDAAAR